LVGWLVGWLVSWLKSALVVVCRYGYWLIHYYHRYLLQGKKKKDKSKGDSDDSEKKSAKKDKKKSKKDKKDKKESSGDDNGKDYIIEALTGGKKEPDVFAHVSEDDDDDDDASAASEAGVDDAGAMDLAVDATKKFLSDQGDNWTTAKLVDIIGNQQMASALKSYDKVHILVRAAFSTNGNVFKNKEIEKFAPAIAAITNSNKIMERHLIAALEMFCVEKPKNFPVMIKQMYDADVLAEETILEWADGGRTEYTLEDVDEDARALLRGEAEPVVVWLQDDADSEDEDSDEE
jgi:translation initiation factor 5